MLVIAHVVSAAKPVMSVLRQAPQVRWRDFWGNANNKKLFQKKLKRGIFAVPEGSICNGKDVRTKLAQADSLVLFHHVLIIKMRK